MFFFAVWYIIYSKEESHAKWLAVAADAGIGIEIFAVYFRVFVTHHPGT